MTLSRLEEDRRHLLAVLGLAGCGERAAETATVMLYEGGSLGGALALGTSRLARIGVPAEVSANLAALRAAHTAALRRAAEERPVLAGIAAALDYLHATMAHLPLEIVRILFLDRRNRLIRDEAMGSGTVDGCTVYVREILFRALELSACGLIVVHNHPSGVAEPSRDDLAVTKRIVHAAGALDVKVHDHLIVGRQGHFSFREAGLL